MSGIRGNYCSTCGKHLVNCQCGESCSASQRQGAPSATPPLPSTANEEVLCRKKEMVLKGDFLYDFDLEQIRSARAALVAKPVAREATWGAVHTVADLARNLLTLDQGAPIYSAFHVDYQGERRCRTRPVSISRERVIDGKWVDPSRKDVPYAVIVWAKQDEPSGGEVDVEAEREHLDETLRRAFQTYSDADMMTVRAIVVQYLSAAASQGAKQP